MVYNEGIMVEENLLLIEYLKTNDRKFFEAVYNKSKSWLFKIIYKILLDKDDTNDVLQETWITVLKNLNKFDFSQGKFNNFLFTVAKNNALKCKKKSKKFSGLDEVKSNIEKESSPKHLQADILFELYERNIMLTDAISKLNKNYQDVILTHYFGEMDVKEISVILQIPEGTVKTRLARGRMQLKKILLKNRNYQYLIIFLSLISSRYFN